MISIEEFRNKYLDATGALVFIPGTRMHLAATFRADVIDLIDFDYEEIEQRGQPNAQRYYLRLHIGNLIHRLRIDNMHPSESRHYQEYVNKIWSETLSFCKYRR